MHGHKNVDGKLWTSRYILCICVFVQLQFVIFLMVVKIFKLVFYISNNNIKKKKINICNNNLMITTTYV